YASLHLVQMTPGLIPPLSDGQDRKWRVDLLSGASPRRSRGRPLRSARRPGDEVVLLGSDDLAADHVARAQTPPLDKHQTIDIGRIRVRAALPQSRRL